jgi:hypothetical protein
LSHMKEWKLSCDSFRDREQARVMAHSVAQLRRNQK